jgi:PAS domain S-box-containing protein
MSELPLREGDLAVVKPGRVELVSAIALATLSLATFAILAPLARRPLLKIDAFLPAYESSLALCDLITAVLLFAHFNRGRSYALLILASAYLFEALVVVPHMLTFPGIFSPSGLLGAGSQTTSWLYCFWHGGFALIVLTFVILRRRAPYARAAGRRLPILAAVAATAAAAAAVVTLATAGQDYLTPIVEHGDYTMLVTKGVSPTMCAICVITLVLLLPRLRASALDLWLGVVMTAWLCDVLLAAVVGASRFDLGWYGGRMFGLFATIVLLVLLLIEFNKLDERLESRTAELRASKVLIERFFENSAECFAIMIQAEGEQFRYEEVNPATLALYGKQRSEVLGRTTIEVLGEPSAAQLNAHLASVVASRTPQRYERIQGDRIIEALATLAPKEEEQPPRIIISARDITERRNLEEQLRQSHKMEAIGQLTGGIAHDFNNMLAIVMGSLDIARRRLKNNSTEGLIKWIDNASEGAVRAATLTSRLLSFSRRQALDPKRLDLNEIVAATSELLRQTIPENVQIETVLAGGLWKVFVDPTQVENALLNLAVNARDAMPNGGKITMETCNSHLDDRYAKVHADVKPGQYVMISITDTGVGMSADTAQRAFEPFFSTKEQGKGTGLGLSQVFGFVKQSHGHVKIYSELGHGTTVKLYLPRLVRSGAEPARKAISLGPRTARGELILVVEDEAAVRQMSMEALRELGFAVLATESPSHALQILTENEDIALLFTDVVMPGMTGRQLADRALAMRPKLKILYTTGYSRNAIVHNGVLDPKTFLLAKPFTIDELAAKLEQILAG